MPEAELDPERRRLADDGEAWRRWGPYLSERAWGTVREDYSHDGEAWTSFSHDQARSRVYRWSEDGLGGICDDRSAPVPGVRVLERAATRSSRSGSSASRATRATTARTPRSTGGTSTPRRRTRGCAGATSTPSAPFPYEDLVAENARRGCGDPEYELLDTGAFDDDRYWDVEVDYAKAGAGRPVHARARPQRRARRRRRCTCSRRCGSATAGRGSDGRDAPVIREDGGALVAERRRRRRMTLTGDGEPEPLFCDNETNTQRLWGQRRPRRTRRTASTTTSSTGAPTVNPGRTGTKAALWYRLRGRRRARRPRCGCG